MAFVAGLILTIAIYGFGKGKIPVTKTALADNQRVVNLYVDGQQRIFPTSATTVGDLLSRAGVKLGAGDIVEPDATTPIPPGSFYINVYRSRPILVDDGGKLTRGYSAYQNPRLILQQLGVKTRPEDLLSVSPITDILATGQLGEKITIVPAKGVTIEDFDGNLRQVFTQAGTVSDLLRAQGIALKKGDKVTPALNASLTDGLAINLSRDNQQIVKVAKSIDFETQEIRDPKLAVPNTVVESEGTPGTEVDTYRVTYRNGVELSRTRIKSTVLSQPKPRIIAKGGLVNADTWLALRMCESSNNYADKYNPNYRGAYQFGFATWAAMGGHGDPANASPSEQDMRAKMLYDAQGWSPWVCAEGW